MENSHILFLAAREQFKHHQVVKAMKSVNLVLAKNPDLNHAIILKANLLATQNKYQAIDYLTSEIAKNPTDNHLLLAKAHLYLQDNQKENALTIMQKLTEDYKNISDVKISAAALLIDYKIYAEARMYLLSALKQDPRNTKARFLMGELSQQQNHHNEALDWYLSIPNEAEQFTAATLKAAEVFITLKAPQEALQVLNRITPITPSTIEQSIKVRVDALVIKKHFREAMRWVNLGLITFPENEVFLKIKTALAD